MVDEDYVGRIKLIVGACVSGTSLEEVPASVITKIMWTQHFECFGG